MAPEPCCDASIGRLPCWTACFGINKHSFPGVHRPLLDYLRVLCIDEFDECLRVSPEATTALLSSAHANSHFEEKPQVSRGERDSL